MEASRQQTWKILFNPKTLLRLIKMTLKEWTEDNVPRLGAALSYYTVFSLGPLLIIAITIAGIAFNNAQDQVMGQVQGLVGENGSDAINSMMEAAQKPGRSIIATILGFATLLFGAAGVFIQLKDSMNTVWDVPAAKTGGFWKFIRKYFVSFSMVLGLGFLLLVSLLLSTGLSVFGAYLNQLIPGMRVVMNVLNFLVSFGVIATLFAMLFKFLPDTEVHWKDVWVGALLTALLFNIGKFLLGYYFAKSHVASAYGAVGSLVLILLWVYYSAQILFFGAEFTQVFAKAHGSRCTPELRRESMTAKEKLVDEIDQDRKRIARGFRKIESFGPKRRFQSERSHWRRL